MEMTHDYFLFNKEIHKSEKFQEEFLQHGKNIYDVVRIVSGIPLFLEDHLARLQHSLDKSGIPFIIDLNEIIRQIMKLNEKNRMIQGNIKLVYHMLKRRGEHFLIAYPVTHQYPTITQYIKGVKACFLKEERPDPNVKNWRPKFKERVRQLKEQKEAYEVILVNQKGFLLEGSQSNFFIIRNAQVYTAPGDEVLKGITRKYVFEICHEKGIRISEKDIDPEYLRYSEATFISGTSPKILPLASISDFSFNPDNAILRNIQLAYNEKIRAYLESFIL